MGVQLPFRSDSSVKKPAAIRSFDNGQIPGSFLAPCGLRNFVMVQPAASAMRAMVAAAAGDGVTLSATGTWRSFDQQKQLFVSRYVTHDTGGPKKVWNGVVYWQLPKVASAAVPGTSNHGLGLAVDLSHSPTVPITEGALRWLANHGPSFGYFNSVKSEAWHWSYCLGDDAPSGITAPPATASDADWAAIAAADAKFSSIPFPGELRFGAEGEAVKAVQFKLIASGQHIAVSGDFDGPTQSAVQAFQRSRGLTDDGRVGKKTWGALGLLPVGATPPPPPTEEPPAPELIIAVAETEYVVRPGDGFLAIAKRVWWTASMDDAAAIATANGLTIESAIMPGQVLEIPECRCAEVAAGDDWKAISERLGVDVDQLREANAWQGDALSPGMLIYGGRRPVAPT